MITRLPGARDDRRDEPQAGLELAANCRPNAVICVVIWVAARRPVADGNL